MSDVTSDQARADLAAALARDLRQLDLTVAAAFVESQEREVERLTKRDRIAGAHIERVAEQLVRLASAIGKGLPCDERELVDAVLHTLEGRSPHQDSRAELDGMRLQLAEAEALIRRLLTTEKDVAPNERRRGERLLVTIGELLSDKQREGAPRA